MNLFKRACALAMALAMTVTCLTGCDSGQTSASSSAASSAAVPESIDLTSVSDPFLTLAGVPHDTVVATAGDIEITAGELLYWVAYGADDLYQYYNAYGLTDMPWAQTDNEGNTLADTLRADALDTAILYAATPLMAKEEGVELSQEFIDYVTNGLENMVLALGGQEVLNYFFWQYPLTPDLYAAMCQSEEFSALLQEKWFGEGSEGYPTDDQIKTYVEDELNLYSVKHILLATSDIETGEALDEDAIAKQKATAEDLVAQLRASDDPIALFDQLMREYSEDPGLEGYPDGYLNVYPGQMVPEFEEASLALEVGGISDVVEAESTGFHIILRLPLEIDADNYRETYIMEQMMARQDQWMEKLTVETTDAYDKLDSGVFYDSLLVLRETIGVRLQEIADEMEAAEAEADASSSADASTSADTSAAASSAG